MYDPSLRRLQKKDIGRGAVPGVAAWAGKIPRDTVEYELQIPDRNFFEREFSNGIHVLRKKVRECDKTWRFSCRNVRNWRKNFSRRV